MNQQRLHELTPEGISAAKNWLSALRGGLSIPLPDVILTSDPYARPVEPEIYVDARTFKTRRDAGIYFIRTLARLGPTRVLNNTSLWSWLGMYYFDTVVRKDIDGSPRLGRTPDIAYVIDSQDRESWGGMWAHRLMLAYETYAKHGEGAWYMLDEKVNILSRFTARLSRPNLFRAEGIVPLAHLLYADPTTRKLKPDSTGWTSRGNVPPGSIFRLITVLSQLYMTYDVYGTMTAEQILPLLPSEFDRFKPEM